jgi:hypothetical protein
MLTKPPTEHMPRHKSRRILGFFYCHNGVLIAVLLLRIKFYFGLVKDQTRHKPAPVPYFYVLLEVGLRDWLTQP